MSLQFYLCIFAVHTSVQGCNINTLQQWSGQNGSPTVECCFAKQAHSRHLSGIFVSISWHRVGIFPVTQKKKLFSLGLSTLWCDIAAAIPTWCRSDVCIAELRAPVSDAKLARLPSAFTCFGQQVSVSVQPSILAKAHLYQHRAQSHEQPHTDSMPAPSLSPRTKRRQQQKARAQKAALRLTHH